MTAATSQSGPIATLVIGFLCRDAAWANYRHSPRLDESISRFWGFKHRPPPGVRLRQIGWTIVLTIFGVLLLVNGLDRL